MPATFLIFLGLLVYLGLTILTFIIFTPLLFSDSKKLFAKKVIATVLVSYPSLIVAGIFWSIIFFIPALVVFWIINGEFIPKVLVIILSIIGLLVFIGIIVISSLYLWNITSKIIYQRIEKKPINEILEKDKVFKYLRPYLIRLKIFRFKS